VQDFNADLILADISYIAGLWVSEVLDLPNVKLSNLPIYEPYHAATIGFPTVLAYNPMDGHGLAPPMVGQSLMALRKTSSLWHQLCSAEQLQASKHEIGL
jgi:hypothetical protein